MEGAGRNRHTQKRGRVERQGAGQGRGEKPARGRGVGEGGGSSLEEAGPRGERAPPPRIQNEGHWSGRSWAREGRKEMRDVVGLRSVVGFLLHPTWRDKGGKRHRRERRARRDTQAETERQRHRKKSKGAKTQRQTQRGGGPERRGEGRGAKGMERQRGREEGVWEGREEGEDSEVSIVTRRRSPTSPSSCPVPFPPASHLYPR